MTFVFIYEGGIEGIEMSLSAAAIEGHNKVDVEDQNRLPEKGNSKPEQNGVEDKDIDIMGKIFFSNKCQ